MNRIVACMFAFMSLSLSTGSFAGDSTTSTPFGERCGAFSISPFVGWYNNDEIQLFYTRPVYGLRLGYDITSNFEIELRGNFVATEFPLNGSSVDVNFWSGGFDFLYNFMPHSALVPYLAAGPGVSSEYSIYNLPSPPAISGQQADSVNTVFTANVGGGLKWFPSQSFAVRADVRHLFVFNSVNVDPNHRGSLLNNWEYSLGVDFLFGGKKHSNAVAVNTLEPAPVAEVVPEAPLQPIPVTEPTPEKTKYFVYLNVEFDIARADIRPQYRDEMAKVGDFMKKYPGTNAIIEGYTDSVGTDEYNMVLSQQRADSVVKSLEVNFGISSSRLTAKAYGKTMPIVPNNTRAGRQANRHINAIIDGAFDVAGIVVSRDFERLLIAAQLHCDRPVFFLGLGRGRQHRAPRLGAIRIRRAGADGAAAVDEELAKIPLVRLDLRYLSGPDPAGALLPADDAPPAAEYNFFAGIPAVGDRVLLGAGILRPEGQRLRLRIHATADQHQDVLGQSLSNFQAHRLARPGDRGKGRDRSARVDIFAGRGNIKISRRYRNRRQGEEKGQERKQSKMAPKPAMV